MSWTKVSYNPPQEEVVIPVDTQELYENFSWDEITLLELPVGTVEVFVNWVLQYDTLDYSIVWAVITLTETLTDDDVLISYKY